MGCRERCWPSGNCRLLQVAGINWQLTIFVVPCHPHASQITAYRGNFIRTLDFNVPASACFDRFSERPRLNLCSMHAWPGYSNALSSGLLGWTVFLNRGRRPRGDSLDGQDTRHGRGNHDFGLVFPSSISIWMPGGLSEKDATHRAEIQAVGRLLVVRTDLVPCRSVFFPCVGNRIPWNLLAAFWNRQ